MKTSKLLTLAISFLFVGLVSVFNPWSVQACTWVTTSCGSGCADNQNLYNCSSDVTVTSVTPSDSNPDSNAKAMSVAPPKVTEAIAPPSAPPAAPKAKPAAPAAKPAGSAYCDASRGWVTSSFILQCDYGNDGSIDYSNGTGSTTGSLATGRCIELCKGMSSSSAPSDWQCTPGKIECQSGTVRGRSCNEFGKWGEYVNMVACGAGPQIACATVKDYCQTFLTANCSLKPSYPSKEACKEAFKNAFSGGPMNDDNNPAAPKCYATADNCSTYSTENCSKTPHYVSLGLCKENLPQCYAADNGCSTYNTENCSKSPHYATLALCKDAYANAFAGDPVNDDNNPAPAKCYTADNGCSTYNTENCSKSPHYVSLGLCKDAYANAFAGDPVNDDNQQVQCFHPNNQCKLELKRGVCPSGYDTDAEVCKNKMPRPARTILTLLSEDEVLRCENESGCVCSYRGRTVMIDYTHRCVAEIFEQSDSPLEEPDSLPAQPPDLGQDEFSDFCSQFTGDFECTSQVDICGWHILSNTCISLNKSCGEMSLERTCEQKDTCDWVNGSCAEASSVCSNTNPNGDCPPGQECIGMPVTEVGTVYSCEEKTSPPVQTPPNDKNEDPSVRPPYEDLNEGSSYCTVNIDDRPILPARVPLSVACTSPYDGSQAYQCPPEYYFDQNQCKANEELKQKLAPSENESPNQENETQDQENEVPNSESDAGGDEDQEPEMDPPKPPGFFGSVQEQLNKLAKQWLDYLRGRQNATPVPTDPIPAQQTEQPPAQDPPALRITVVCHFPVPGTNSCTSASYDVPEDQSDSFCHSLSNGGAFAMYEEAACQDAARASVNNYQEYQDILDFNQITTITPSCPVYQQQDTSDPLLPITVPGEQCDYEVCVCNNAGNRSMIFCQDICGQTSQ